MKIHIETLLTRLEDSEKRHRKETAANEARVAELNRDKTRLEELLNIREGEVERALKEQRSMAEQRDKDRDVIRSQGEHLESIKRELDETRRRMTEGMVINHHKQVIKKPINNSNSPTES
jgi:chromosome segregation ATPase